MPEYIVEILGDYSYALAYAQEVYVSNWAPVVPEGQEPPPPPTVDEMPQVLTLADLDNRLREMEAVAASVLPTLQGITDPAGQEQVLNSLVASPAMRAYIQSKLTSGG
jgi:hypothetical protein